VSTLVAENLAKRYKARNVVTDATFRVDSGEVVGLLGPNGAGKTTCFYMVVGLIRADAGRIWLRDDGKQTDLTNLPVYKRSRLGLSYLPQEPSIFRRLTVADNIASMLELKGYRGEEISGRLEGLLDELHISHLRGAAATSLSGGERRRVEIARALATSPRFMLLDEPFAGIDPISVIDIQKIVSFLTQRGIGVLITDHNVRETLGICHRAYILSDGRVIAEGHPSDILRNQQVRKVYLGDSFRL
jgi:lipopolysaccharide export system ATP-binding protein